MTNVAQNCQSLRSSYTTVPLAVAHTQKIRQEKGKQGGGRVNKSKKDFFYFYFSNNLLASDCRPALYIAASRRTTERFSLTRETQTIRVGTSPNK